MSDNRDDEKSDAGKVGPLDLAPKVAVKGIEGKTPLLVPRAGHLRVLTSGTSAGQSGVGSTILTTNIVSQAVLKQGKQ